MKKTMQVLMMALLAITVGFSTISCSDSKSDKKKNEALEQIESKLDEINSRLPMQLNMAMSMDECRLTDDALMIEFTFDEQYGSLKQIRKELDDPTEFANMAKNMFQNDKFKQILIDANLVIRVRINGSESGDHFDVDVDPNDF